MAVAPPLHLPLHLPLLYLPLLYLPLPQPLPPLLRSSLTRLTTRPRCT